MIAAMCVLGGHYCEAAHQTLLVLGLCRGWREPWAEISSAVKASEKLFFSIKELFSPWQRIEAFLSSWQCGAHLLRRDSWKGNDYLPASVSLPPTHSFSYTPFFSQIPVKCTVITCLLGRCILFPNWENILPLPCWNSQCRKIFHLQVDTLLGLCG